MQRFDHVAEFVEYTERIEARRVAGVRRKKRQRLISPVVDEPGRRRLFIERKYRQQFDRRDAQFEQIRDLFDEPRERAAPGVIHAGARIARKSTYM